MISSWSPRLLIRWFPRAESKRVIKPWLLHLFYFHQLIASKPQSLPLLVHFLLSCDHPVTPLGPRVLFRLRVNLSHDEEAFIDIKEPVHPFQNTMKCASSFCEGCYSSIADSRGYSCFRQNESRRKFGIHCCLSV